ncbi:capsid assembly scaffolding protein Gp46 family protein [Blastococcus mobilis]|uniref:Scaffolding protein n=1 Tax=Blastococcus mobilis TaxID=1938746 RepID=A0A238VF30_9ACTN|nr:DUF4355 domain-containing protein [Blastococcus mobilis]SNR33015.1 protein of unknown function [Blastococcus mobilis]
MAERPRTSPASMTPELAQQLAADFLAARRARHGDLVMRLDAPPADQPPADTPPADTPPADQPPKDEPKPEFTQADLDRVLKQRLADEQAKWQKKLDDAQALAGKNETEKLTIERDQAQQRAAEATQKAAERVAKTEAKVAALAAGANPERVAAIVRNADLAAAVKDGDVDEAAVKAAVEKVLTEYPEWKAGTQQSVPSSSGGDLNGGKDSKPTFTRKQLEEMPPDEMAKRIDEINEAIADGRVTG